MKTKIILISSALILSVTVAKAQAYAGFGIGYGMPIAGTVLGYNSTENTPNNTFSTENVKGSFGKGLNFGGYFGYMTGEHMGLELGVNYLTGSIY
ncbi:MAG TPA: hypothetical protein VFJ43_15850, partial [Bacteroidia bacterium]|nr:hypothetical protein [Bacteroidia bacterium]